MIINKKEYRDESDELEYIPKWLDKKATKIIEKEVFQVHYEKYFDDLIKSGFVEDTEKGSYQKEEHLLIETTSKHSYFFVPKELQKMAKEINSCEVIGGASGYCVEDVVDSLKYFGVDVTIRKEMLYEIGKWKEEVEEIWEDTKQSY